MRKFNKNIAKEFKTSFGRFIAIMAIIALGVGFLIGVTQATPDMKNTMSRYLIDNNAYDVDVKGTYGLTAEDIENISALDEVDDVTPIISSDALVSVNGGKEIVGRIIGIENIAEGDYLNTLTLEDGGRMPASGTNEVVVVRSSNYFEDIQVGDTIRLPEKIGNTEATYGDIYNEKTFEVVGVVSSPDYYYKDSREVTTLGTGVVGCVIYGEMNDIYIDLTEVPSGISELLSSNIFGQLNSFLASDEKDKLLAYTDCYVRLSESKNYERFTDGYKNFTLKNSESIKKIAEAASESLQKLIKELNNKYGEFLGGKTFPAAQWLLLDRASTNQSYISYDMNVEKVEEIAGIFPIFFIVVAALVALTSMTRMVEEDRMQIGTFKALGYGNGRIMSKYLIYCCLASVIGCVVGILLGFSLLPSIFWKAYGSLYELPSLILAFSPWFALIVFAVALAGTALVTWATCRTSLKERPSKLMQPKAPKAGKRILLERVGFFWNHLKFKWKATIRNIFRYKKNMILTIISVMGCTALILTGFGLNDSVNAVTDIQYNKVILYDTVIEFTGDLNGMQSGALREFIGNSEDEGERYLPLYGESGTLVFDGGRENVDLYLVENAEEFQSFVSLHERKNSAIIDVTKAEGNAVVIPENIAIVYDISVGDTISYSGNKTVSLTVCGINESYTGTHAYMSRSVYEKLFGEVADNTIFVKSGVSENAADEKTEELLSDPAVSSVEFVYASINTFAGLSSTMGLVIAVLVLCAGALAAIVLYNLTNINIDERRKEIATLRVLGYRKWEVAGYIYRESAILTFVGTLLGLGLGFLLHLFIVSRVNSVSMMMGRVIGGWSYLWAFLITIAFAVIVYAFMLIKLNRINMAESLKSNE